jgi:hypothetical protein
MIRINHVGIEVDEIVLNFTVQDWFGHINVHFDLRHVLGFGLDPSELVLQIETEWKRFAMMRNRVLNALKADRIKVVGEICVPEGGSLRASG